MKRVLTVLAGILYVIYWLFAALVIITLLIFALL